MSREAATLAAHLTTNLAGEGAALVVRSTAKLSGEGGLAVHPTAKPSSEPRRSPCAPS